VANVIFFDENCAFSPSLNETRPHGGGGEIHEAQICEAFAGAGHHVAAYAHGGHGQTEHGVVYRESRTFGESVAIDCDVLIVQTSSRIPSWISAKRTFTHQIHDPRPCRERWQHFANRSDITHVCVSGWQAGLFAPWKTAVIHPPLNHTPWLGTTRKPGRFVSCASWNKGTDLLLAMWPAIRKDLGPDVELVIGSPYSEPSDAAARCVNAGASWAGRLPGSGVPELIATAGEGLLVVNVHPETFGVTVGFARALGVPVYIYCEREMGALGEAANANEYVIIKDVEAFRSRLRARYQPEGFPPADLSLATHARKWLELTGLT
jgi:hypothetical protein